MATSSSGPARTAPKGKATPTRAANGGDRTLLTPTIQWVLVTIAGLAILGAIIYFGSDFGDGGGGVNHSGLAPAALVDPPPTAA